MAKLKRPDEFLDCELYAAAQTTPHDHYQVPGSCFRETIRSGLGSELVARPEMVTTWAMRPAQASQSGAGRFFKRRNSGLNSFD